MSRGEVNTKMHVFSAHAITETGHMTGTELIVNTIKINFIANKISDRISYQSRA